MMLSKILKVVAAVPILAGSLLLGSALLTHAELIDTEELTLPIIPTAIAWTCDVLRLPSPPVTAEEKLIDLKHEQLKINRRITKGLERMKESLNVQRMLERKEDQLIAEKQHEKVRRAAVANVLVHGDVAFPVEDPLSNGDHGWRAVGKMADGNEVLMDLATGKLSCSPKPRDIDGKDVRWEDPMDYALWRQINGE